MSSTTQQAPELAMSPMALFTDLDEELEADKICEALDKRPLKRLLQSGEQDKNVQTYLKLQSHERQLAKRLEQIQADYRKAVYQSKLAENFLLLLCGA